MLRNTYTCDHGLPIDSNFFVFCDALQIYSGSDVIHMHVTLLAMSHVSPIIYDMSHVSLTCDIRMAYTLNPSYQREMERSLKVEKGRHSQKSSILKSLLRCDFV
jgi:hypothetical protein